jgi:hypothetical protein
MPACSTRPTSSRAPDLRPIEIPEGAAVAVMLAAGVATAANDRARAAARVEALTAPATVAIMRAAGFGPVPG